MEKTVTILNEEGMHARPAAVFVKKANTFSSEIVIDVNGKIVNGKSIMGIMALGLTKDTEINIKASGDDAQAAVDSLTNLVNNKFNL